MTSIQNKTSTWDPFTLRVNTQNSIKYCILSKVDKWQKALFASHNVNSQRHKKKERKKPNIKAALKKTSPRENAGTNKQTNKIASKTTTAKNIFLNIPTSLRMLWGDTCNRYTTNFLDEIFFFIPQISVLSNQTNISRSRFVIFTHWNSLIDCNDHKDCNYMWRWNEKQKKIESYHIYRNISTTQTLCWPQVMSFKTV